MVSTRQIQLLTRVLSLLQGLLILALVAVGWHMVTRERLSAVRGDRVSEADRVVDPPRSTAHEFAPLSTYAAIWQRDLRQAPFPPKVKDPEVEQKPPTPLPRLLGTFREAAQGWAHVLATNGQRRVLRIGDGIDAYTLIAVEPGRAQFARGRETYWIEVPKPKPLIVQRP
jgi:hypothetical protein